MAIVNCWEEATLWKVLLPPRQISLFRSSLGLVAVVLSLRTDLCAAFFCKHVYIFLYYSSLLLFYGLNFRWTHQVSASFLKDRKSVV